MSEEKKVAQTDLRFIIGNILRQERKSRVPKLSQNRVGELVNEKHGTAWGKQYVGQIELGKKMSFDSVAKIADVLEINWAENFGLVFYIHKGNSKP